MRTARSVRLPAAGNDLRFRGSEGLTLPWVGGDVGVRSGANLLKVATPSCFSATFRGTGPPL